MHKKFSLCHLLYISVRSWFLSICLCLCLCCSSTPLLSFHSDKMFSFSIAFFHGLEWFWCKVVAWFVFFGLSESIAIANAIEMVQTYAYVSRSVHPRVSGSGSGSANDESERIARKNLSASINPILDVIPRKTSELILSRVCCCIRWVLLCCYFIYLYCSLFDFVWQLVHLLSRLLTLARMPFCFCF